MKNIKIAVVDDSPFSVAMISSMLTGNGFEVVGTANSLQEAVDVVTKEKPDIVTMDITMPGADGIEVTKALHVIDPELKVIIVSSMMDEEIINKAKKERVSGYIQKPVDAEELSLLINRLMADEELYNELEELYYQAFKEALTDTWNRMFKNVPTFGEQSKVDDVKDSRGMSVVMGIIGEYCGRMILDMSADTAKRIGAQLFGSSDLLTDDIIINMIAELSNIVAGNACSLMNKSNKLFGLRVAPPTVVYGESVKISKAILNTVSSVKAESTFGEIYLNVGFSRSGQNE